MSTELVITRHVRRANAKAVADYIADVAGLTLSIRPLVQLADQPVEIETMSGGFAILHATLAIELDAKQVATIEQLAEQGDDEAAWMTLDDARATAGVKVAEAEGPSNR